MAKSMFWMEVHLCRLFILLYVLYLYYRWRSSYQMGGVGIPLTVCAMMLMTNAIRCGLFVIDGLGWGDVRFVDLGRSVDHYCLNVPSTSLSKPSLLNTDTANVKKRNNANNNSSNRAQKHKASIELMIRKSNFHRAANDPCLDLFYESFFIWVTIAAFNIARTFSNYVEWISSIVCQPCIRVSLLWFWYRIKNCFDSVVFFVFFISFIYYITINN